MNEWISVKERLPEKSGTYLVYLAYREQEIIRTVYFSQTEAEWETWVKDSVSYWMPLPEPPQIVHVDVTPDELLSLRDRDDLYVVELALELYARSGMYPTSKEIHDAWVRAKKELLRRLQTAKVCHMPQEKRDGV